MEALIAYSSSESECEGLEPEIESKSRTDFFNLASDDSSRPDCSLHEHLTDCVQPQSHENIQAVDFWNDVLPPQTWTNSEKIWGVPSTVRDDLCDPHPKKKRALDDSCVDDGMRLGDKSAVYHPHECQKVNCNEIQVSPSRPCFMVHHKIAPYLHLNSTHCIENKVPRKILTILPGHSGTVNRISWCTAEFGHLLLSAAMDATVRIWNVFSSLPNACVRSLTHHSKAVRDAVWSACGREILSCGYDKSARICDVETGSEACVFSHQDHVLCARFNPADHNLFVTGLMDVMFGWDRRCASKPIRQYSYKDRFQQVQDICFFENGSRFVSCNDVVGQDTADRNIMVWDFSSGAVLSNQIYHERYTCTRLRVHPSESTFFAQSHGDYIAEFSTIPPYKMNKCKRFEGHKVSGYNVGFDVSPDGKFVASGSADGNLFVYDSRVARLLKQLPSADRNDIVLDVVWHPILFSTIAGSTWKGHLVVWQ